MLSIRKTMLAALALGLALAVPAPAAPVTGTTPAAGGIDKYLPDDTEGVVTFNVRAFLDSALIKKLGLEKELAKDETAQKQLKALGLDPFKDVERVVVGIGKNSDEGVIVIQGKFDPAKLHAAAEAAAKEHKENLTVHKTDDGKIYELTKLDELFPLPPAAAGANVNVPKQAFVVIADKGNVVLTSSKEAAAVVLSKAKGKKTTKLGDDAAAMIGKVDAKQTIAVALPAPPGLEKVKTITGGITITKDVKADVKVTTESADAAKDLADQLTQLIGFAKIGVGAQKELAPLADVLDAIKADAKDSNMIVTADVKGDVIEKLVKAVAELAAKQGAIK